MAKECHSFRDTIPGVGRTKNESPTETFTISTTPTVVGYLKLLAASGLFGKNHAEAAERILGERIRAMRKEEPDLFRKPKK